jgi:hypothetical protein
MFFFCCCVNDFFFYECPIFITFLIHLFLTNVLACWTEGGNVFCVCHFTGTEGNIDKGLVMGSRDWEGTWM